MLKDMAPQIWVSIGSRNGLFLDSTKPLLEPMLISHYYRTSCCIHPRFILLWLDALIKYLLQTKFWNVNKENHCIFCQISLFCSQWSNWETLFTKYVFLCNSTFGDKCLFSIATHFLADLIKLLQACGCRFLLRPSNTAVVPCTEYCGDH